VVVTQPDRPGDRGKPAPRPVADAARELLLPVWQPLKVRDPVVVEELLAQGLDALIVAAYGQILPATLLDGPRRGGVNVHASLLPRWRGAAPVAAAILAGDAETGVSIMRMEAGLDTGPVYARRATPIAADDTTPLLTARLAVIGAELLTEVLAALEAGTAVAEPQDDAQATLAPRLSRADGIVNWRVLTAVEIDRRVRALQPWPGVVATLSGGQVRIIAGAVSAIDGGGAAPGDVVHVGSTAVDVATVDGVYSVHAVQPAGRRVMDAAAYLRGRRR
jgi:methionyl-tRNA formyltransferase